MGRFFRRVRGLAGVGVTWGALWGAIGAGVGLMIAAVAPEVLTWTNPILDWAIGMGAYGFVSGVGFGGLLSLGEGKKTIFDLSLMRVAVWGVLGSVTVPLIFGALGTFGAGTTVADMVGAIAMTGLLGGTFAPGSVAIARRAALSAGEDGGLLGSGSR